MLIRPATPEDAERLAALGRRLFFDAFGAENTAEDMDAYLASAFSPERQRCEISDPATVTLIADDTGEFVGYAQLRVCEPPPCVGDREAIELVRLYVDRTLHGRGVSHELMRACLEAAVRRARSIWLGVWERNPRAIAFYAKWGFVDVGSHVFQLGADRQIDRIMWRRVAGTR